MDSLLSELSSVKLTQSVGIEDVADRASYLFSVAVISASVIIVTTNTYFMSSINCYVPITVSGENMDDYLVNYCWVHGTIPAFTGQVLPEGKHAWRKLDAEGRINYYQWVPFVLGLQGVLYYIPRIIWMMVCNLITGNDLEGLIMEAKKASNKTGEDRKQTIEDVASCLYDMFFHNCHDRHPDRIEMECNDKRRSQRICNIFGTGNLLFFAYFIIKILYLINAIGQLFLMQKFLGIGHRSFGSIFGWQILSNLNNDRTWKETSLFPRVSYCFIGNMKQVDSKGNYVAQCALPINMINEKIYIFLWFWTVAIVTVTVASLPLWLWRMGLLRERRRFVKNFLKECDNVSIDDKDTMESDPKWLKDKKLERFVRKFLQNDGVFVVRLMSLNAGNLITGDIVVELWRVFRKNMNLEKSYNDESII